MWLCKAMQKSRRFKPAHLLGPRSGIPVFLRLMAPDTTPEMPSLPSTWAISQGMFAGEGQMQMQRGAWGPGLTSGLRQPLPARAGGDGIWQQANCLVSKSVTLGCYIYSKNFSSFVECFSVARSAGLLFYYRHPAPSRKRGGGRTECTAVGCKLLEQTPPWPSLTACTVGQLLLKRSCFYYFQFCSQTLSTNYVPDLALTTGP